MGIRIIPCIDTLLAAVPLLLSGAWNDLRASWKKNLEFAHLWAPHDACKPADRKLMLVDDLIRKSSSMQSKFIHSL
jgi:hypothetical protein